jgi:FAD/FMN-containing dehydrogenase
VQHDISVPVEKMPDFVDYAIPTIEAAHPGTEAVAFGHLGDGNVHFHVIAPKGAAQALWETGQAKQISSEVYAMVTAWGGSISAEHGIGQIKIAELERLGDPVALTMMRQIKQALDPLGLLNPGKLVNLAPSTAKP